MRVLVTALTVTAVSASLLTLIPAARAGQSHVPPGFNFETRLAPGPVVGVLADGTVLVSTGVFGADQLSRLLPDGSATLFATGFGSLGGLAQSPVTGRIVVGDSLPGALWVLEDLNDDGDCLDPGEMTLHPVALPLLSNGQPLLPEGLAFKPGTDELFVKGTTSFSVPPVTGAIARFADGAVTLFVEGTGYGGGMVFEGDTLFAADLSTSSFIGRVIALTDGNADGDAADAGELVEFASGLSGASDLVRAADGHFYLSGTFDAFFNGALTRLAPDADNDGQSDEVTEAWATGFAFASGLLLLEGSNGFVPGAAGDGVLFVGDFSVTGNRIVRSAPTATLSQSGTVANNSVFTLHVGGERGAQPLVVLALQLEGPSLFGYGDLRVGFALPHLVAGLPPIDGSGSSSLSVVLHGLEGAVGTTFRCQAFTLLGGDIGVGEFLDLVIGA